MAQPVEIHTELLLHGEGVGSCRTLTVPQIGEQQFAHRLATSLRVLEAALIFPRKPQRQVCLLCQPIGCDGDPIMKGNWYVGVEKLALIDKHRNDLVVLKEWF